MYENLVKYACKTFWWWQNNRMPPPTHVSGCEMSHLLAKCSKHIQSVFKLIGHPCNDQLTAVKKGYRLTSVTWLYRGLKCTLIEVTCFLKVIRWLLICFNWLQTQVHFLFRRNSVYFLLTAKIELWYLKIHESLAFGLCHTYILQKNPKKPQLSTVTYPYFLSTSFHIHALRSEKKKKTSGPSCSKAG